MFGTKGFLLKNRIFRTILRLISFTPSKICRLCSFHCCSRHSSLVNVEVISHFSIYLAVLYILLTNTKCTHQYFNVHSQKDKVLLQSTMIKFRIKPNFLEVCKGQHLLSKFVNPPSHVKDRTVRLQTAKSRSVASHFSF